MNKLLLTIYLSIITAFIGLSGCTDTDSAATPSGNTGKGGSMSRFAVIDDYLYTIAGNKLPLFDIKDPASPIPWINITMEFGIETLFAHQNNLYVGSNRGVHIFDNSDPQNPVEVSFLLHQWACDPVVVQGDYAYVTLRSGNGFCGTADNQLDVINISDIANPKLEKTYPMQEPAGLGIDGSALFICDGVAGLKVFDATDPLQIQHLETLVDIDCYDVIPNINTLIISDDLGILQYNYASFPEPLEFLSEIQLSN